MSTSRTQLVTSGTLTSGALQPTITAQPPDFVANKASRTDGSAPLHSTDTSGCSPRVSWIFFTNSSSVRPFDSNEYVAPNSFFATSNRSATMSVIIVLPAPIDLAAINDAKPIGPAPRIKTVVPKPTFARRQAWIPTESGSSNAPSSIDTWSGNL